MLILRYSLLSPVCNMTSYLTLSHVTGVLSSNAEAFSRREDADEQLFFSSRYNPNHVPHRLLSQHKTTDYNLRQRTHNLTLPMDVNAVIKEHFVYTMLFRHFY